MSTKIKDRNAEGFFFFKKKNVEKVFTRANLVIGFKDRFLH